MDRTALSAKRTYLLHSLLLILSDISNHLFWHYQRGQRKVEGLSRKAFVWLEFIYHKMLKLVFYKISDLKREQCQLDGKILLLEIVVNVVWFVFLQQVDSHISQQVLVNVADFLSLNGKIVQVGRKLLRNSLTLYSKVACNLGQINFLGYVFFFFLGLLLLLLGSLIHSLLGTRRVDLYILLLEFDCLVFELTLLEDLENILCLISEVLVVFHIFFDINKGPSSFLNKCLSIIDKIRWSLFLKLSHRNHL